MLFIMATRAVDINMCLSRNSGCEAGSGARLGDQSGGRLPPLFRQQGGWLLCLRGHHDRNPLPPWPGGGCQEGDDHRPWRPPGDWLTAGGSTSRYFIPHHLAFTSSGLGRNKLMSYGYLLKKSRIIFDFFLLGLTYVLFCKSHHNSSQLNMFLHANAKMDYALNVFVGKRSCQGFHGRQKCLHIRHVQQKRLSAWWIR